MNFDLDDNQLLFKTSVERFVGSFDISERQRARAMVGGFDRARWHELSQLGLIALAVPESRGGLGGSFADMAVVAEALGYGLAPEPWLECGFLPALLLVGSPWLDKVMSGDSIAAFAFAEAKTRFALDAREVTACENADHITLSGEKHFVLGGAAADLFIVTANVGDETKTFVLSRETPGLFIKPYAVVDGSKAAMLTLHNVRIQPANQLSHNIDNLNEIVSRARLMASAEMVGLSARLFDETLNYVKTREQFGQPIGRFQTIQHRMVESYTTLEQMRSAHYRAVLDNSQDWQRNVAGIKAFIGEKALIIGHEAVQLHGGMGMTEELLIGHAHKRILLLSKLFGDPAAGFAEYARAA